MSLFIYMGSGLFFFLGLYLSFEYWDKAIFGRLMATTEQTTAMYKELFLLKSREQVLRNQIILSSSLALLVFLATWPEVFFSVPMASIVFWVSWKLPLFYLRKIVRPRRISEFSVQMVDALTLMGNGLKSGLNLSQTMQIVVDEMPNPISQEYNLVLSENKVGLTLEQALENLAKRIVSEDVQMFVTSVNILKETGGNIAETFATITETIRQRMKIEKKIQAMTAQGFMSAVIVGLLPWGLAVVLYVADPSFMLPLFTTIPGWIILMGVFFLQTIGFLTVLKIIKIRV